MADDQHTAERAREDDAPEEERRESRPAKNLRDDDDARQDSEGKRDAKDEKKSDGGGKDGDEKKLRSRLPLIILGIAIVIAAIGGIWYWWSTKDLESTDDAFTDGRAITIEPHVSGYVTKLAVNDNQFVHAGDTLIEIDPRDYVAARDNAEGNMRIATAQARNAQLNLETSKVNFPARLEAAKGQLEQARAQLFNAQTEYRRQHSLPKGATTQQAVDQSTANLQSAQGQVMQAEAQVAQADLVTQLLGQAQAQVDQLTGQEVQARAQLAQADLNLGWTRVVAPQDGTVTKRNVERGNYASAGASIMSLVTPDVWVTANFKETQLARMRPGQQVDIAVDAYPSLKLHGHIDSVQLGSGSKFTAFPAENATGNYVKIVQRVPVKIVIDSGLDPNIPLPLGISVTPTVHLK
jgi:membrane fusion protein (multidrug efflux system)